MHTAKVEALLFAASVPVERLNSLRGYPFPQIAYSPPGSNAADLNQTTERLEELARRRSGSLGWQLGLLWNFNALRLIGYCLLRSRTYGEYTDRYINYMDFMEHPLAFVSSVDSEGWHLTMTPRRAGMSATVERFCVEEASASVFPIAEILTGHRLSRPTITLRTFDAERDRIGQQLLDADIVSSGATINRMTMRLIDRMRPLRLDRKTLLTFCEINCGMLLPEFADGPPLLQAVRQELLLSCGKPPKVGDVALSLGLSKRTLNRKLAEFGLSYISLVDRYRMNLAMALLLHEKTTAKDVAYMCSFDSARGLRRAFAKWTGQTISQWSAGQR
ncbi:MULTISPECIES: helix-turn-helix transcriptional regulator [Sphingobium]|uniref:helix-turn-helix transcriptional regulator n=1 Tax=Sphingobium sp. MI1205 TaxID=407020 RepID=UPI0007807B59|nr:AraC family transcriptional regulator [Sphingobium sp. MI1205]